MTSSTTAGNTSPPKSPSIHVREPSTTKVSLPAQSMHTLSPLSFATPSAGARSPSTSGAPGNGGSIPSSPTSIHSSSSAIFERDIEQPITSNSLHLLSTKDPHHTARAVAHEPLENSVPSVLSAAVTALGEVDTTTSSNLAAPGGSTTGPGVKEIRKGMSMDDISVIAPAPLSPQNWTASTAGSIRLGASRSPSPHLLPLPGLPSTAGLQQQTNTGNKVARPAAPKRINTNGSTDGDTTAAATAAATSPSVIDVVPPTPNANTFGFTPATATKQAVSNSSNTSPQSSPLIVTPPLPLTVGGGIPIARSGGASRSTSRPTSIAMSLEELSLAPLVATTADSPVPVPPDVEPLGLSGSTHARPPSPNTNSTASKRLSFISYNDLLNSTPMSSFPLSSITSGCTADSEPPHQVDVTLRSPRRTRTSSRQSTMNNRSPVSEVFGSTAAAVPAARTSVFEDENLGGVLSGGGPSLQHSHDVGPKGGGEWEREGLGSGLEERLEAALSKGTAGGASSAQPARSDSSIVGA